MRRISTARLAWAILGVVVLAGAIWVTHAISSHPTAVSATAFPAGAVPAGAVPAGAGFRVTAQPARVPGSGLTPSLPYPFWCCQAGNPPGLTVTGQATVHGTGAAARAGAVAKATADAAGQARAAAAAAGVSLGQIISLQVSASYYPYPVPMGAASGTAGPPSASPGASGGSTSAVLCPATAVCPDYRGAGMSATVTVTWAIA